MILGTEVYYELATPLVLETTQVPSSTAQLAKITEKINKLDKFADFNSKRSNNATVTFISDDGRIEDYTLLKPIFQSEGVPFFFFFIRDIVGVGGRLSRVQLLDMQNL